MDENDPRTPDAQGPAGTPAAGEPRAAAPGVEAAGTSPEAEARLRAADPAGDVVPDAVALRAAVDAARARAEAVGPDAPTATRDELAARRARRWTGWPARAAGVAAAALLVGGGGGYALGAAGTEPAAPASDVITAGSAPAPAPMTAPETAAGAADVAGGVALSSRVAGTDMAWSGWGRTVFTSSGLPDDGGTAQAWGFDPAAAFTQERVAAAAAALGVAGEPELTDGVWGVGPRDGSGAGVTLYADGTATLNYYDPTKDPWSCSPAVATDPATTSEGSGSSGGAAEPSVGIPEQCGERDLGAAPTGDAAVGAVRDALAALGQDPASYELVSEDYGDTMWTYVTAHHVLAGQRTGLTWSASLTGAGLQSLYGSLAPVVDLGEYGVVSPAEAVERLGDPRFGTAWGGPVRYLEGAEQAVTDLAVPPSGEVPATPEPGGRFAWPVDEVTITDFRLGSALHGLPSGAAALLPTYELISADGAVWTVLALTEDALDLGPVG
ncbi:hypothetical protein [Actinotalea solisilvae]|uniref:hypothetical protein n=1 Tax=Actinotalea solisilvae TaxID=2072922 RepID=UPI0018F13DDD|nr:hypothetical protein [Actinotalea solisilvae]